MSQGEQTILINRYISIAKQGNTVATSDFMFDVNMKWHLALSSCWDGQSKTYWAFFWYSWRKRSWSTAVFKNLVLTRWSLFTAMSREDAGIIAASGTQLSSDRDSVQDYLISVLQAMVNITIPITLYDWSKVRLETRAAGIWKIKIYLCWTSSFPAAWRDWPNVASSW